jgi:cholesterol transport system auxiliary component
MIIIQRVLLLVGVLLIASLSACISLIKEPSPITVYSLRSNDNSQNTAWPVVPWSLTIARPISNTFLDSNRIVVRPEANILKVYQGANWSDSLPDLVQEKLLETFENSGKIKAVSRQNSGVPAEVALLLDIRQFESVYISGQKKPNVLIQIHAKLLEYPSNRVIASKTFNTDTTTASKDIPDVVQAFETGMNSVNQEIVGWALANGHGKTK